MNDLPQLLTTSEVLRLCRFTKSTLHRLVKQRKFPQPIHIGPRSPRWRLDELNAWLSPDGDRSSANG